MTAPDPRVGEIQARLDARTEGPWVTERYFWKMRSGALGTVSDHYWWAVNTEHPDCHGEIARLDDSDPEYGNAEADAEFIAAAPADVAYLLGELRDRDEKLADAWDEANKAIKSTIGAYAEEGVWAFEQAEKLNPNLYRAAVAAAGGGGE